MKDPNEIVSAKEFERIVSDKFLDRQLNAMSAQQLAQVRMVVLDHLPPDDPEVISHQAFLNRPDIKRAAEHYKQAATGELADDQLTADEAYHVFEYARALGLNMPPTLENKNVFDI